MHLRACFCEPAAAVTDRHT